MEEINNLNYILRSFNINADCIHFSNNESYFYYDLVLQSKTKVKDIDKIRDEIALSIKAPSKPSMKILHDKGIVRLEFVSKRKDSLKLFDYFTIDDVPDGDVLCLLGQDITGNRVWMDLSKNPHMIIAGTTGSGKSVAIHNIIANLFNYNDVYQFLIDPKQIEFCDYNDLKNVKVCHSYNDAIKFLDLLLYIMEHRYGLLRSGVDSKTIPYIILIIDEFSDLILQDINHNFYNKLCKLAQKCRASKICIVLSTQRPSTDIINGTIKSNFPARISCKVSSNQDSRIIIDSIGAESLNGQGDALLKDHYRCLDRFQIAYTDAKEVCSYFKNAR